MTVRWTHLAVAMLAMASCNTETNIDDPGKGDCVGDQCGPEVCDDGVDNDGNGRIDCADPVCRGACDADGDGFVSAELGGRDCDDNEPDVFPGAVEVCNGIDDDCDGLVDDDDDQLVIGDGNLWYIDGDQDGYGDVASFVEACVADPTRYTNVGGDCDDTNPDVFPGAPEIECDFIDNDCDPTTLDGRDDDNDGFVHCVDCDDNDPFVNPGVFDVCDDGFDSDCDGFDCAEWTESFETGELSEDWSTGGNRPWTVQDRRTHDGVYAAVNGNINDNQQSWMRTRLTYPSDGEISFWYRTSTERSFDYLEFYVDNRLIDRWAGEIPWTRARYPVPAGTYNFEWRYVKDGSVSSGEDSVYVDLIETTGFVAP